jgi:hypothetical protein
MTNTPAACPRCQAAILADAAFCYRCGAAFARVPASAAPLPVPAEPLPRTEGPLPARATAAPPAASPSAFGPSAHTGAAGPVPTTTPRSAPSPSAGRTAREVLYYAVASLAGLFLAITLIVLVNRLNWDIGTALFGPEPSGFANEARTPWRVRMGIVTAFTTIPVFALAAVSLFWWRRRRLLPLLSAYWFAAFILMVQFLGGLAILLYDFNEQLAIYAILISLIAVFIATIFFVYWLFIRRRPREEPAPAPATQPGDRTP